MYAVVHDHPAIVEKLLVARADVNTKNKYGCALPLGPSGGVVGGVVGRRQRLRLRRPEGTQRCTMRRPTAAPNPPGRCSSAAADAAPTAPAPSGRMTALHIAAYINHGCTKFAVALLVGGADQTITNEHG